MATLDSFNYSADKKPIRQPTVVQRRNKLIARIWEQMQLLISLENGTEFTVNKLKTVKDINGNTKRLHVPKRLKPWWFNNADGKLCVSIRYGSATLQLKPGMTVIQANNSHQLLEILETVKKATANGELDKLIEQACITLKTNFIR